MALELLALQNKGHWHSPVKHDPLASAGIIICRQRKWIWRNTLFCSDTTMSHWARTVAKAIKTTWEPNNPRFLNALLLIRASSRLPAMAVLSKATKLIQYHHSSLKMDVEMYLLSFLQYHHSISNQTIATNLTFLKALFSWCLWFLPVLSYFLNAEFQSRQRGE